MAVIKPLSQEEFEEILEQAQQDFFTEPVFPRYDTEYSLGVSFNTRSGKHEAHPTGKNAFVEKLEVLSGLSRKQCWLLALAHEAGHVELNARCLRLGLNPNNEDDQLRAIGGAVAVDNSGALIAQCHKESAIEAYCDAKLVEAIFRNHPSQASRLLEIAASIRQAESSKPHRFGDDYKTYPFLEKAISHGAPLKPEIAASLAFNASRHNSNICWDAWLIAKRVTYEHALSAGNKLSQWRGERAKKVSNDTAGPKAKR